MKIETIKEANVNDLIVWLQDLPMEFRKHATIEGVVTGHALSIKRVIAYQAKGGHCAIVVNPMGTHLKDDFGYGTEIKLVSTMNYDGEVINADR